MAGYRSRPFFMGGVVTGFCGKLVGPACPGPSATLLVWGRLQKGHELGALLEKEAQKGAIRRRTVQRRKFSRREPGPDLPLE